MSILLSATIEIPEEPNLTKVSAGFIIEAKEKEIIMKKVFMAILLFSIIFTGIGCAGFKDKINNIMQNLNLAPQQGDSMVTSPEPEAADDAGDADG